MSLKTNVYFFIIYFISSFLLNFYYDNLFFVFFILSSLIITIILQIIINLILNKFLNKLDYKKKIISSSILNSEDKKNLITYINTKICFVKRLFLVILFSLIFVPISSVYYQEHRIVNINNIKDFNKIYNNLNGTYRLKSDLDFSNYHKESEDNTCNKKNTFDGTFIGNGNNIENLKEPLFTCIGKNGQIRNLYLKNINIQTTSSTVGAFAKINYGIVERVSVSGKVNGEKNVGGLIGENFGSLFAVSFSGEVIGTENVGGIVGSNYNDIISSYVSGSISGIEQVGGISGSTNFYWALIKNNLIQANITGIDFVGGVSGYSDAILKHNIIIGNIFGQDKVGITSYPGSNSYYNLYIGNVNGYNQYVHTTYILNPIEEYNNYPEEFIINKYDLQYESFFINKLKLNVEYWDLKPIQKGKMPTLKNILQIK